ncbi:c-type cytochrome [Marinicella rhabdoformis]|uniref:c-type cytochrome n=1 Tax=Marinicella rhabdoformis TaxID=2580566 RepID=UPI0012AEB9CE|nr:cytochrome c [Marinicella rhabdoformis]
MKNIQKNMVKFVAKPLMVLSAILITSLSFAADYPEKGDFQKGAKAWAENCARCHNMRDPKDLRDDQWITTVFHMRVRAGLTGQKTRDILTFLQESNNPPQPVKISSRSSEANNPSNMTGKEVYEQTCIACHGKDGKGAVPGVPDLTIPEGVLSQSEEVLLAHIRDGFKSKNSPMAMPAKGGNPSLSESDLLNVVAYMKSQFKQ